MDFFSGLLERSKNPAGGLQRRRPGRFEPPPEMLHSGLEEERGNGADARPPESRERRPAAAPDETGTPTRRETSGAVNRSEPFAQERKSRAHDSPPPSTTDRTGDRVVGELLRLARAVEQLGRSSGKGRVSDTDAAGRQHIPGSLRPQTSPRSPADTGETTAGSVDRRPPGLPSNDGGIRRTPVVPATAGEAVASQRTVSAVEAAGTTQPATRPAAIVPKSPEPTATRQRSDDQPPPMPIPGPKPVLQPLLQHAQSAAPGRAAIPATDRHAATSLAEREPTTVHVSIGRIEIRAVPTPAKAARSTQPTAPRLSLDDYLKARDGGRR